ncbi:DUF5687 family protein [Cryomorphaceae bacterium 1068]|nr:DUF5687 family protein [Cryomorphaceae bacterium 1068]
MKKPNFLKHAWLSFRRSPALTQNLLQTLFLAFFGFYIAVSFLISGLVAGELIRDFFPGRNVLGMAGAFLIYYLPMDILMRYFLQKFPTLSIRPYLLLPVSKSAMIHYLLRRSLFSFYSFLPLFLTFPFFMVEVLPNASSTEAVGFIIMVLGLIVSSNYISFWVSKASDFNNAFSIVLLLLLFGFLFLEYKGITSFFPYLESAATAFFTNPIWWAIPILISVGVYLYLFSYFKKYLTAEKESKDETYLQNINLGFFGRFGRAGRLMDLELRLLLRSKRARSYLLMSLAILFLPLAMGVMEGSEKEFYYLLFGLFMTGMIALNHGQLMLSWNSLHFDLLLSRGNTIQDIFRAKYYILALSCAVTYVLTLPYVFYDPMIVVFNTALLFINMSFSIYMYMALASYNSLRVDPNEGGSFSMSGFGAAHYLIGIPIMIFPIVLFYVGKLGFGSITGGILTLLVVGVLATIFHQRVIDACVKLFTRNRYKIAAAFRKA